MESLVNKQCTNCTDIFVLGKDGWHGSKFKMGGTTITTIWCSKCWVVLGLDKVYENTQAPKAPAVGQTEEGSRPSSEPLG